MHLCCTRFRGGIFVEMSLPNGLNVTMEIKCYLLTLIKHLPSFFLSRVNGQNRVASHNFQRLKSREYWFDSKLKLSLGSTNTAGTRDCKATSAHPFPSCSQSPPKGSHQSDHNLTQLSPQEQSELTPSTVSLAVSLPLPSPSHAAIAQVRASWGAKAQLCSCHFILHLYQGDICILIIWVLW